MLALDRLVVLVDAEEADVEVVARVLEVIRVAAEEGGLLLRGEDDADVGVLLERVEVVLPAGVERDHVGPDVLLRVGSGLLEFGDLGLPRLERLGGGSAGLHRRFSPRRSRP